MKPGANPSEINRMKRMYAEGLNAQEISDALLVALPCVESFLETFNANESGAEEPEPAKPKAKKGAASLEDALVDG